MQGLQLFWNETSAPCDRSQPEMPRKLVSLFIVAAHIAWQGFEPSGEEGGVMLAEWSLCHQYSSHPWADESRLLAASPAIVKLYPARIKPSTAAPSLLLGVDGPVRSLAGELMDHALYLEVQVEPPTSTTSCTFFCSMLVSRRCYPRGPWNAGVVHAQFLEACSKHERE